MRARPTVPAHAAPVGPFIDREGYLDFIDRAEGRFQQVLADQE